MLYLDEQRLMEENPWFYCSAWLEGEVFAKSRGRIPLHGGRPFDLDKDVKKLIRHRIATQIFPENTIPEVPRGEVVLRLVTVHPLPHIAARVNPEIYVSPELFVGACYISKDLDNIAKIYMDAMNPKREDKKQSAMNGLLWHDDRQCCWLEPIKTYAFNNSPTGLFLEAWYRRVPMIDLIVKYATLKRGKYYDSEIIRNRPDRLASSRQITQG